MSPRSYKPWHSSQGHGLKTKDLSRLEFPCGLYLPVSQLDIKAAIQFHKDVVTTT